MSLHLCCGGWVLNSPVSISYVPRQSLWVSSQLVERQALSEESKHVFQSPFCCDQLLNPPLSSGSCLQQEKHKSVVSTGFGKVVLGLWVIQSQLHSVTSVQIWYWSSWKWNVLWKAPEREWQIPGWYLWSILLQAVCYQQYKVIWSNERVIVMIT